MKLKALSVFALAAATASLSMACTADAGDPSDDANADGVAESEWVAAKVTPGSFKLYSHAHEVPLAGCDVHTRLDLAQDHFSTATLTERAVVCKVLVPPDLRTYRLRLTDTDCGTRFYAGSRKVDGKSFTIKITDNRARLCLNVVDADVIVEETAPGFPGAITTTKYSYDGAPVAPTADVTLEGTLTRTFGIGGENTGVSIATKTGMIELILDAGEQNQFVAGKKARATGASKLLSGVETHNRKALDVKSLLVCPDAGQINCMPGPNRRLSSLCSADSRGWVGSNCAGVLYLD